MGCKFPNLFPINVRTQSASDDRSVIPVGKIVEPDSSTYDSVNTSSGGLDEATNFSEKYSKQNEQNTESTDLLIGCGFLFFIAVVIAIFLATSNNSDDTLKKENFAVDKIDAWTITKTFVTKRLKSPSSASFGSVFGDYQSPDKIVTNLGDGEFETNAWVDAQNSFGATIRTHFVCKVKYSSSTDRWQCTKLEMFE